MITANYFITSVSTCLCGIALTELRLRLGLVTAGICNLCISASLAEFLSAYPTLVVNQNDSKHFDGNAMVSNSWTGLAPVVNITGLPVSLLDLFMEKDRKLTNSSFFAVSM